MNKSIYLGLSILKLKKIVMYEFWYDYLKPKCNEKAKLCYMDTENTLYTLNQMIFVRILQWIKL